MKEWYNKEYFDTFEERMRYTPRIFTITKAVNRYKPKTVLDVGCGIGMLVKKLRQMQIDAIGIDYSPDAGKDIPKYFQVADIKNIPYPDNSFDMVLCTGVFEHIKEEDIDKAYSEMKRVGGRILATICFKKSNYFTMKNGKRSPEYHITIKPKEWWEKKLPDVELIN